MSDDEPIDVDEFKCILKAWDKRAYRSAAAHYKCAEKYFYWARWETIVNALLSIFILFLTNAFWIRDFKFGDGMYPWGTVAASLAAALLVLLTMLQFLLRHQARAYDHKMSAQRFSNLSRKIERYSTKKKPVMGALHAISRRYSDITTSSPTIPNKIWKVREAKPDDIFARCHGVIDKA